MSKITGMKAIRGRDKRLKIYLDGDYACTLLAEVALKEKLRVGSELSPGELEAIVGKNTGQSCYNSAVRFIGYRPRSEYEIRQRLLRHGYDSACAQKTLARLKEQGLVDDEAFARFWKDNRESFSPRGRRLTRLELKRKGLDGDTIEQVLREIDENDSAYRAALTRARRISPNDFNDFRRRLGGFLGRRGFGYDVIAATVEKLWKERENSQLTANSK